MYVPHLGGEGAASIARALFENSFVVATVHDNSLQQNIVNIEISCILESSFIHCIFHMIVPIHQ